jgi:F0F1-type ATP synthase alpha subunit
MENLHKEVLDDIRDKKDLTDDIISKLNSILDKFVKSFKS